MSRTNKLGRVIKEGWLTKKGGFIKFRQVYQWRYFKLVKDKGVYYLHWFISKEEAKKISPRNSLLLTNVLEMGIQTIKDQKCFYLKTKKKVYSLRTKNSEEGFNSWVQAIAVLIPKNKRKGIVLPEEQNTEKKKEKEKEEGKSKNIKNEETKEKDNSKEEDQDLNKNKNEKEKEDNKSNSDQELEIKPKNGNEKENENSQEEDQEKEKEKEKNKEEKKEEEKEKEKEKEKEEEN
ncbi:tandem ph domain containing protein [Anaeramoeba flamelloides]|uniref:Tandem ph domain containing protein n=1 Tax=Anaeramoeba flamelloides TaxID=1746091 RepID=A0ABQ8XX05_9EUKA|nr:tandem ph domain containing protein [Anaeramoeba flamelloides]